jgi:hypothetical protein
MTHLTDTILIAAVSGLPETFESHHVIQAVMTSHPQEYVRELYENVTAVDPIRTTHAVIGRTLHRIPGIVAARRVDSANVRGPETENQQWQKLVPVAQPGDDPAAAGI